MNPPNAPANPNPSNIKPSTPPPLADDAGIGLLIDSLLKRPVRLILQLCETKSSRHWFLLLLIAVPAFALYGLVVGSFHGGGQYYVSPAKVMTGGLLSILICFPSFYIFSCLAGIDVQLRGIAGVMFAMFALTGVLLLGFAPVAWVFSQSTTSESFIAILHLVFWFIAAAFGARLLRFMTQTQNVPHRIHLRVWLAIFILVSLQMTTTLRPIIGASDDWLPKEKKFFLTYWVENLLPETKPGRGSFD